MEHIHSTPPRQVRFQLQDKENIVFTTTTLSPKPGSPTTAGRNILKTMAKKPTPTPPSTTEMALPQSSMNLLRHQLKQKCRIATATPTRLVEREFQSPNIGSSPLGSEGETSSVHRMDHDPVASKLLQDADVEMDDVVTMCGDLKDWSGLIRPVPRKMHRL